MINIDFRVFIYAVAIATIIFAGFYTHHRGYVEGINEKQLELNQYQAAVRKAADEQSVKARDTEARQASITNSLKANYEQTKTDRDIALRALRDYRLCEVETVSGGASLSVAEGGSNTVSSNPKTSAGTDNTAEMVASFSFSNAIKDHDQCNALIKTVCGLGMCQ